MKGIKNVSDFEKKVKKGKGLWVIRFCAEWSGPCQIMGPIYEDISGIYKTRASFCKIDVDEMPLIKAKWGVTELPTFLFFKNGESVDFLSGLISREALVERIEHALKFQLPG